VAALECRRRLPTILLTVGTVTACGSDRAPQPERTDTRASAIEVRDTEGRTVAFGSPPERIISLVPSATHALIELGARDRLVGRTDYDTAAALATLPSVGGGLHPTIETLIALEPDFVIRFAGQTDVETPARLDDLGVAHLAVAPESVADTKGMILDLGRIVGREEQGAVLVQTIDSVLADIRSRVAALEPVRVAWVVGGDPPWVSGPGTYIDDLLSVAGGRNVFDDLGRLWAATSVESLVARQPDLVLTVEGSGLDPRILLRIPVRRVSATVSLPGPDLPRAATEIAEALHPGLFEEP
jgi:iron complex transport system substrate-binding protein